MGIDYKQVDDLAAAVPAGLLGKADRRGAGCGKLGRAA